MSKKAELRADADEIGSFEGLRVKCQREHVLKARVAAIAGRAGGEGKTRLLERGGPAVGSVEDELKRK
jgi:protein FRG1